MNLAVLLITFNRPDTALKVVESLRKVRPSRLYVSSDGPRDNVATDAAMVDATRTNVLNAIDWECEVNTFFQESNLGSRVGVVAAIDWFLSLEEEGVIIEDDCVPGDEFLPFCSEMLRRYRHYERVMSVLGDNTVNLAPWDGSSYGFIKYGWPFGAFATWRRAWKLYDRDLETWKNHRLAGTVKELWPNRIERKVFAERLDHLATNPGDIWDLQWSYSIDNSAGLSIFPAKNLVSNIGFRREDATHTHGGSLRADAATEKIFPLVHPSVIDNDRKAEAEALYGRMWGADKFRIRYWIKRFFRKATRRLAGMLGRG